MTKNLVLIKIYFVLFACIFNFQTETNYSVTKK
jgi:hypothetical protein